LQLGNFLVLTFLSREDHFNYAVISLMLNWGNFLLWCHNLAKW